jgi:hypothetical protein
LGLGSYVDGPRLARIGWATAIGSLALICPAYDGVCDPGQDGLREQ